MKLKLLIATGVLPGMLVSCGDDGVTEPEEQLGHIQVRTVTTGFNLDPNGYSVDMDEGQYTQAVGLNDTLTMSDVLEGSHTLELTDVAPSCAVSGSNPRNLTVSHEDTASTVFEVACEFDLVDTWIASRFEVTWNSTSVDLVGDLGGTVTFDIAVNDRYTLFIDIPSLLQETMTGDFDLVGDNFFMTNDAYPGETTVGTIGQVGDVLDFESPEVLLLDFDEDGQIDPSSLEGTFVRAS